MNVLLGRRKISLLTAGLALFCPFRQEISDIVTYWITNSPDTILPKSDRSLHSPKATMSKLVLAWARSSVIEAIEQLNSLLSTG